VPTGDTTFQLVTETDLLSHDAAGRAIGMISFSEIWRLFQSAKRVIN